MKRTKIICTMGPNTNDYAMMKALAEHGMDVARFNFSHGDYEEQKMRLNLLKSIREELDLPIAALLDTKGPEIRTGLLKDGKKVNLKEGEIYILTTEEIVGDDTKGHINYDGLNEDVIPGNRILIDDGLIELEVLEVKGKEITCKIINGGELGERKGVNVPNVLNSVLIRALISLQLPLYVQLMLFTKSRRFWMSMVPIWPLSPRSKMQKALKTWMISLKPATASWLPAAIWELRSRPRRFRLFRRAS